jgi:hypothetical protein
MAKYSGSPPCAAARADPNKAALTAATTPNANLKLCNEERIRRSLDLDSAEDAIHPSMLRRRTRLVRSYRRVKEIGPEGGARERQSLKKETENIGNKMEGTLVSSIAIP